MVAAIGTIPDRAAAGRPERRTPGGEKRQALVKAAAPETQNRSVESVSGAALQQPMTAWADARKILDSYTHI
ncbi:hypothetical protein [Mesorhizobium sp. M1406]|uniref:hypothetical protein n=1 Tax=Mesorhizobium sp. M1406 TaxID=2957099 RepID=UPI00333831A9